MYFAGLQCTENWKLDFAKVWQLKCCELVRKRALQSVWHQGKKRLKALADDAVYESQE